jgi:UDP-N-acetylmuramyl pentapeptide synthase
MPYLEMAVVLFIFLLGLRTLCWHLQCWQIREYRFDRMQAWLRTNDGRKQYFTPWLSQGLLPRPKLSGRLGLILAIVFYLSVLVLATLWLQPLQAMVQCWGGIGCANDWYSHWALGPILFLVWERSLWLQVGLGVYLSNVPVRLKKLHLFHQAGQIVRQGDQNIIRIGITGSYGKSSTKELLVHLLKSEFGEANVLFNPANNNTEVAIARLILKHEKFFKKSDKPKFLVIETGAYKKGEIGTVAKMIQPQYSILTGLNQQHVELFGSIQKTREAKFELAEGTLKTVFFNGDNRYLQAIFSDRKIKATNIPISFNVARNLKAAPHKTNFDVYSESFILPWPGEFFVHNALLALELCREIGVTPANLAIHLATLKPLERAMSLEVKPSGFTVLTDTYSANPDGVLKAIEHLKNFSGKRIFVSIPLRELGGHATTVHQQIFEALKDINALVYWEKSDFSELGKKILGANFHSLDSNFAEFKALIKTLEKDDVVLLESKLSQKVLNLFK